MTSPSSPSVDAAGANSTVLADPRYARSLAHVLVALLQQGGSRVVDREQVRQQWRIRYQETASTSRTRTGRRPVHDSAGTRAKSALNRAYRGLEQAGAVSRDDDGTVRVVDVRVLVEFAREYAGPDEVPADSASVTRDPTGGDDVPVTPRPRA